MQNQQSVDDLFKEAVSAIDTGDAMKLKEILSNHPVLLSTRLEHPGPWLTDKINNALNGFFKKPYLLSFIAEDPVRNDALPSNIADIASIIIDAAKKENVTNLQEQLDQAIRLVAWSWVAKRHHVQIPLIDVLIDAGACPDVSNDALVNQHTEAAAHLVKRGAKLTLATAVCLNLWKEAAPLAATANPAKKQFALVLSALNGNAKAVKFLLDAGADVNKPSNDLYSHGTPLHHAVWSGNLEAVKVLIDAGADLNAVDTAWQGTPLGWALYGKHDEIAEYFKSLESGVGSQE